MTTSPTLIVAYVDDQGRYSYVADAAARMASTATARLIFYAPGVSGGRRAGQQAGAHHPGYLELEDLSEAGLGQLASEVRQARDSGVQAFAWVPESDDVTELAEYAAQQGADMIMLPAEKGEAGFLERLFGHSFQENLEQAGRQVALVGEDGSIDYPQHEEAHQEGAESTEAARKDARQ